jgi:hypothetical protein
MSSYRPPHHRRYPDRDAEKREAARKAEEEIRKKNEMNETNFPTLSTARPTSHVSGNQYAKLAQRWAVDEEVDRRVAEHKKFQEATERYEKQRMVERYSHRSRHERLDDEYDDEEELAPEPRAAGGSDMFEDDSGWTEVKRKAYKPKRELTVEEMDEMDRRRQAEERGEDDFNAHLFESNRHDHDRV